jgi:hypothetical protein
MASQAKEPIGANAAEPPAQCEIVVLCHNSLPLLSVMLIGVAPSCGSFPVLCLLKSSADATARAPITRTAATAYENAHLYVYSL